MKRREFIAGGGGIAGASVLAAPPALTHPPIAARYTKAAPEADPRKPTRRNILDPTYIDPSIDCRSISFENPSGERGAGGKVGNGRKRRPCYVMSPGEKLVLVDLNGPGTIRHIWTVLTQIEPEVARGLRLEVFYNGLPHPSVSVPILDFFGLSHGRAAEYYSALISANEGKGLNSFIPMPFEHSIRMELTNESASHVILFYQVDYTLDPLEANFGSYLHVTFRRENLTTLKRDFVIASDFKGPGRFLGCAVGVRIVDEGRWYGEGEVKIYRDGDERYPTYCGTGLEDYAGSAWGLGRHYGPYSGAPIHVSMLAPSDPPEAKPQPKFVNFYRWHLPDPIMFTTDLKVTIQQIGIAPEFRPGQEQEFEAYKNSHVAAGPGWSSYEGSLSGFSMVERQDDYCASAFVFCQSPQAVVRYKTDLATSDIALLPGERKVPSVEEWERIARNEKLRWNF